MRKNSPFSLSIEGKLWMVLIATLAEFPVLVHEDAVVWSEEAGTLTQEMLNSLKSWQPTLWRTLHISFYPQIRGHNQTSRTIHIDSGMSDKSTQKMKDNSFTSQQRMLSLYCSRKIYRLFVTVAHYPPARFSFDVEGACTSPSPSTHPPSPSVGELIAPLFDLRVC